MPTNAVLNTAPDALDTGEVLPANNQADIGSVALATDLLAEGYVPTLTSSGAGVLAAIGTFRAHGIKDAAGKMQVIVRGSFQFTRAAAGVAETITMTLPPSMLPTAVFGAATAATGDAHLAGIHAATDFCGTLIAVAAARTVSVPVTDNAASSVVNVIFSYQIS